MPNPGHTPPSLVDTPTNNNTHMSNTVPPYTLSDALNQVRSNIIDYQECFEESTDHYKHNETLLQLVDVFIKFVNKTEQQHTHEQYSNRP
jgi:hypothetical protein